MTYVRKTRDEWHLLVNYGYGWEDEVVEDSRAEIQARKREYLANCYYPIRIVRRRVPIDAGRGAPCLS